MSPRRLFTVLGPACLAGFLASAAGAPAVASVPPSEETITAGLNALLDELGTVTYEGDDITIGECPLVDDAATTTAFAAVADDVDLAAEEEAQIEMFVEYEMDQEFEPAGVSCDFEATADDAGLEAIGILVLDPEGDGVSDVLESLTSTLEPDDADEALAIGGELRGACVEHECLFLWSGGGAVVAVSVEFGDEASPDVDAVTVATRELVTAVAGNVAERP